MADSVRVIRIVQAPLKWIPLFQAVQGVILHSCPTYIEIYSNLMETKLMAKDEGKCDWYAFAARNVGRLEVCRRHFVLLLEDG